MDNRPPYPLPQPTPFTATFWDACQREVLEVSICSDCDHKFLPGGPVCPRCWSKTPGSQPAAGFGEVFSFVVYHRTYHPAIPAPYTVAIITLDEGVRLVSNIVNCDADDIRIGMRVKVVFEEESGFKLPRFEPAD